MTPDRYGRLCEIFAATCDLPPPQRAERLDRACLGDAMLRAEAEALLAGDRESGSFLRHSCLITASRFKAGVRRFLAGSPLGPGHKVGPYRIDRELGAGSQSVVYLAEEIGRGRKVALKVLSPAARVHPQLQQRFTREAQAAGRLGHPGICQVHAADVEEGIPYLAMQYIEGETLASCLSAARRGCRRFDAMGAAALIETVARAVHAAHEAGVIHRDLKPANIMVTPEDEPVVLDFGLARDERSAVELTATGDVFGTPAYMAPEQIEPGLGFVDRRTDVYALGIILYECLTLHRPYEAQARESLYREILASRCTGFRRRCRHVPRDLRVLLATAMARDQDRRYQTARDLAEDLACVRRRRPIVARSPGLLSRLPGWSRRHAGPAALAVAILLALASGFVATATLLHGTSHLVAESGRVTDLRTLVRLMRIADEDLWPVVPATVPAMDRWLAEARALHGRLEAHEAALASRAAQLDDEERATAAAFIRDFRAFSATIDEVRRRRSKATAVAGRAIDAHRRLWHETIDAIAAHPGYGGLHLTPQPGLTPIGQDPDSGLFEFGHPRSGEVPNRDPVLGTLCPSEAMGLVFVLVPGGSFDMGAGPSGPDDEHRTGAGEAERRRLQDEEGPVHRVALDPYLISKYEMTQGQWLRLTGSNPSHASPRYDPGVHARFTLRHPVESLPWTACVASLARHGLVLPTEAQWEYAGRAGTRTIWWTGNEVESLCGAANLAHPPPARPGRSGDAAGVWPDLDDAWPWHAPVGMFRANPFGLHDVHGNVRELVQDALHSYEYPVRAGDGLRLPPPDAPPPRLMHLSRGGAFAQDAAQARSARRHGGERSYACGLRPARLLSGHWCWQAGRRP